MHIAPNNKRYYGITSMNPKKRWQNGKGYKENKHFTNAINKYNWNNIEHKILFNNLTESEAKLLEQFYIALYDTINRDKGYNISIGGEGSSGCNHTEEWKQQHSKKMSGKNNPMYGIRLTGKNNSRARPIICITTRLLFYTAKEAAKHYNINSGSDITRCCKGKRKSAGKLPDGTKLVWRYVNYKHNRVYRVVDR